MIIRYDLYSECQINRMDVVSVSTLPTHSCCLPQVMWYIWKSKAPRNRFLLLRLWFLQREGWTVCAPVQESLQRIDWGTDFSVCCVFAVEISEKLHRVAPTCPLYLCSSRREINTVSGFPEKSKQEGDRGERHQQLHLWIRSKLVLNLE